MRLLLAIPTRGLLYYGGVIPLVEQAVVALEAGRITGFRPYSPVAIPPPWPDKGYGVREAKKAVARTLLDLNFDAVLTMDDDQGFPEGALDAMLDERDAGAHVVTLHSNSRCSKGSGFYDNPDNHRLNKNGGLGWFATAVALIDRRVFEWIGVDCYDRTKSRAECIYGLEQRPHPQQVCDEYGETAFVRACLDEPRITVKDLHIRAPHATPTLLRGMHKNTKVDVRGRVDGPHEFAIA